MRKFMLFVIIAWIVISVNALTIQSIQTDRPQYSPGDSGVLYITLTLDYHTNPGETLKSFKSLNLQVFSSITGDREVYIGNGQPYNTITLSIPFTVPETQIDGAYPVRVRVSGYAEIDKGTTSREMDSVESSGAIYVVNNPVISVKMDKRSIEKKGDVNITTCSKNGRIKDAYISVMPPFTLSNGKEYIGNIEPNECKTISVEMDASLANNGPNQLIWVIFGKNSIGQSVVENITTTVYVEKVKHIYIKQLAPVDANRKSTLSLKIWSDEPIHGAKVSIDDQSIQMIGVNKLNIGDIGSDGKDVGMKIFTQLPPGIHPVKLKVEWNEDGKVEYEYVTLPLEVNSDDKVNVYLEGDGHQIIAGKKATISVIVSNGGDYEIKGTTVSIHSDNMEILDIENEKFVGSVDPDDYTSDQFDIIFKKPGKYKINVIVKYYDSSGQLFTKTKIVDVVVGEEKRGEVNWTLIIVGIVAIAIVGYIAFKKMKK